MSGSGHSKKIRLSRGELHIVDDFLGSDEVLYLQETLNTLDSETQLVESCQLIPCKNCDDTDCPQPKGYKRKIGKFIASIERRVLQYANDRISLSSTLKGNHSFTGKFHQDLNSRGVQLGNTT